MLVAPVGSVFAILIVSQVSTIAWVDATQPFSTVTGSVDVISIDGDAVENRSNVVVFLERATGAPVAVARPTARMSQANRRFSPRVLPVVVNTTVEFPNDDRIFHNIFSLSRVQPFDLGVYPPGELRSVTFSRPGLVKVFCNIHPDMVTNIIVLNSPHFSTTDSSGTFTIRNVPNGRYVLRVWHEFALELRQEITLGGGVQTIDPLQVREDRRAVPHTDKFGRPYRRKY